MEWCPALFVCADAGIRHVDRSVDGGIPLHSFQEGESGVAKVAVLRERCDDHAQRYSGGKPYMITRVLCPCFVRMTRYTLCSAT